MNLTEQLTTHI